MVKTLPTEVIPLTPDVAKQHNLRPHVKGDRDYTSSQGKARCAWLNSKLEQGKFYAPCWGIAELNGTWYRIDGGHSSTVLAQANGHFPKGLDVVIRKFQCDSKEDLIELFNEFDNRKSVRTASDKIKVHKSAHDDLDNVTPTAVADAIAGIICYLNDGNSTRTDDDDRTALIHSHKQFIAFSYQFVKKVHMKGPGVIACMFRGYLADPAQCYEFWNMVMNESHPDAGHSTRRLARYLREIRGKVYESTMPTDPRAQYAKSIHAWNAWQRRTTTDLKYREDTKIPEMFILRDGKFVGI